MLFMTYSEFAQIKLAELNKPDENDKIGYCIPLL